MSRPVLETIRSLLRFKNHTTIPEIASMAELPKRQVLEIVNRNGAFVYRDRSTGRITRVDTTTKLREQLWDSEEYYRIEQYGAWSKEGECLKFKGHDALREKLKRDHWTGGLGDSFKIEVVENTEENRAEVEAAGMTLFSEQMIDDRLWVETPAPALPA